jgi:hypothetical protein
MLHYYEPLSQYIFMSVLKMYNEENFDVKSTMIKKILLLLRQNMLIERVKHFELHKSALVIKSCWFQ